MALAEVRPCKSVFVYVSYLSEVVTHGLIKKLLDNGSAVTVPKIVNPPIMLAHRIYCWDDLRPGKYGILEPAGNVPYHGQLDLCLAPGLAFSAKGDRLGYGKGHYDYFLAGQDELLTIGLAFECQIVQHLPTEPTDQALDLIVTEERVIRCSQN